MKFIVLAIYLLLCFHAGAQRVYTLDPETEVIAHRTSNGSLQFSVPVKVLTLSLQESITQITDIDSIGIEKIGKSNYLIARGKERSKPGVKVSIAMLLAETSPGEFQADNLIISCSSAGDCRECSIPPICKCNKGEGSCGQNNVMIASLKKVTVTLFE